MAQYDIVFAVNEASSGELFSEQKVRLSKGQLLVGTTTFPTALGPVPNNQLMVGDSGQASGFALIGAASDHQVFRRSGTGVGFGAINLASANAVSGLLPQANVANLVSDLGNKVETSRTINIVGSEEGPQNLSANRTWHIDKVMRRRGVSNHSNFNTAIIDGAFTVWDGNWWGSGFTNTPNGQQSGYGVFLSASTISGSSDAKLQMWFDNNANSHVYVRSGWDTGWNSWKRLATIDEAGAGAHTHSANDITSGILPLTRGGTGRSDGFSPRWITGRTLTVGNTGKSVTGAANVSWSLAEIGAAPANVDIVTVTNSNRTLILSDAGSYIRMVSSIQRSVTIPPNSSVNFPAGTVITIEQGGTGAVEIVKGSGVTCNGFNNSTGLAGIYSVCQLIQISTNNWTLIGGVEV